VFIFVQRGLQCLICVALPKHLICKHLYFFSCDSSPCATLTLSYPRQVRADSAR